jgi:hypothetical protein
MPEPITPAPARTRQCGTCGAPVVQAFTPVGTAILLDYPAARDGAVAAFLDGDTGIWRARYRRIGEIELDNEARFRQHDVTCTHAAAAPLVPLPDMTDTALIEGVTP